MLKGAEAAAHGSSSSRMAERKGSGCRELSSPLWELWSRLLHAELGAGSIPLGATSVQ